MKNKAMSDGEVNDFAFKRLVGDLDGIEAEGMFNEKEPMPSPNEGTTVQAHGVSVVISPMDGEQTKEMPEEEDEPEEDSDLKKLGK